MSETIKPTIEASPEQSGAYDDMTREMLEAVKTVATQVGDSVEAEATKTPYADFRTSVREALEAAGDKAAFKCIHSMNNLELENFIEGSQEESKKRDIEELEAIVAAYDENDSFADRRVALQEIISASGDEKAWRTVYDMNNLDIRSFVENARTRLSEMTQPAEPESEPVIEDETEVEETPAVTPATASVTIPAPSAGESNETTTSAPSDDAYLEEIERQREAQAAQQAAKPAAPWTTPHVGDEAQPSSTPPWKTPADSSSERPFGAPSGFDDETGLLGSIDESQSNSEKADQLQQKLQELGFTKGDKLTKKDADGNEFHWEITGVDGDSVYMRNLKDGMVHSFTPDEFMDTHWDDYDEPSPMPVESLDDWGRYDDPGQEPRARRTAKGMFKAAGSGVAHGAQFVADKAVHNRVTESEKAKKASGYVGLKLSRFHQFLTKNKVADVAWNERSRSQRIAGGVALAGGILTALYLTRNGWSDMFSGDTSSVTATANEGAPSGLDGLEDFANQAQEAAPQVPAAPVEVAEVPSGFAFPETPPTIRPGQGLIELASQYGFTEQDYKDYNLGNLFLTNHPEWVYTEGGDQRIGASGGSVTPKDVHEMMILARALYGR